MAPQLYLLCPPSGRPDRVGVTLESPGEAAWSVRGLPARGRFGEVRHQDKAPPSEPDMGGRLGGYGGTEGARPFPVSLHTPGFRVTLLLAGSPVPPGTGQVGQAEDVRSQRAWGLPQSSRSLK